MIAYARTITPTERLYLAQKLNRLRLLSALRHQKNARYTSVLMDGSTCHSPSIESFSCPWHVVHQNQPYYVNATISTTSDPSFSAVKLHLLRKQAWQGQQKAKCQHCALRHRNCDITAMGTGTALTSRHHARPSLSDSRHGTKNQTANTTCQPQARESPFQLDARQTLLGR